MRMWRSLLFVPANQRRMLDKMNSVPADGYILDLEDTIPIPEKANARAMAREYMAKVVGLRGWVRVNSLTSGYIHEDIEEFVGNPGLAGFVVPKQDSFEDVVAVDRMMASVETRQGLQPGCTPIIVAIESAAGVLSSQKIAAGAKRIESMVYAGGEDGDMNLSLGAIWSSAGPEMMFGRQFTLVAARALDIHCPLDGVYSNIRDLEGFKNDTTLSRRLGYRGRCVIHPSQVGLANQIYTPTAAEIGYYTRVLAAYNDALTRGTASTTVDGKLVDIAMAKTAQRLLDHVQSIKELEALFGA
ncbi:MAG: CoA ester lyase [Betaproteobacteria bacterium]|nr:MAG: CoA ester lyase [Betaproteobacteria bacterium]